MSDAAQLLELDHRRRQAMIGADADALESLLADDLIWTHSSGITESKAEFINAISKQQVEYQVLEVEQDQVRSLGPMALHQGTLKGTAVRDGQAKSLYAKFVAVWRAAEVGDEPMQLIAWQSTNCSA